VLGAAWAGYAGSGQLLYATYQVDAFSQTFKLLIALGLVLVMWLGQGLRGIPGRFAAEYYLFLSLSCLGLCAMVSAVELLTIVISTEIASYALYVLIPLRREEGARVPLEASIKYILFGGIATGITLYGMSYLFGLTHTTFLAGIAPQLPELLVTRPLAVIALVMLLCGLFYKLALFPMHFWMPDVFVGAANETTCFVATLPKIGALALLIRIVAPAGGGAQELLLVLSMMAVLSMTLGNLSALGQVDIKRMLAYSSIAHAGYMMVGIISLSQLGLVACIYYVYGYLLMNVACFYVIYNLAPGGGNVTFGDLKGLYKRSPLLAAVLAAGAMGLSGIPPTIGFTGKFVIFTAALQQELYWLMALAVGNVCISAFYYLKLVRAAYSSVENPGEPVELSAGAALLGVLIIAGIIAGGIFPQNFISMTGAAISALSLF
jgi:proton-translocating NADH-quinone oxidoreductase chain N